MKFTTPFLASELKKELKSFGVKVLMCKQYQQNAMVAVEGSLDNVKLFVEFCELNSYNTVCNLGFRLPKTNLDYVDFGHIFKYIEVKN